MFCAGVCTQSNVPSVSSINRILRNRAAERAATEYAKMASQVLHPIYRPWFAAPVTSALPYPPPTYLKTSFDTLISKPDCSGMKEDQATSQTHETDGNDTDDGMMIVLRYNLARLTSLIGYSVGCKRSHNLH